ncbi:uncharacterized protein [Cicer arietinum]|uniref:uncharacterized protein n=1 Tax=Cicer arietinum TaxID=3827 RepID=UPI003CC501EA
MKTRFVAMWITLLLSQYNTRSLQQLMPKSSRRYLSHWNLHVAEASARHLAYELERDMVDCFFERQGKGFGVTPKSFFPQEKHKKSSNEEVLEKLRILSEQVALLVNTNKDKQLPVQLQPEIQMESETGSCNVGLKSIPEGVTTCVLYLSSPTQRKVVKGILYNTSGEVLHNIPIPAGHVKVSPTVAFEPTAPLPIPDNDGDMKFLSDAIGSYVAWPTNLVALQKKIPKDKSVTSPEKVQINKPPLQPKKGSKPQKLEVNRAAKLQRLEGNKAAKLAATKNLDRGKSVAEINYLK